MQSNSSTDHPPILNTSAVLSHPQPFVRLCLRALPAGIRLTVLLSSAYTPFAWLRNTSPVRCYAPTRLLSQAELPSTNTPSKGESDPRRSVAGCPPNGSVLARLQSNAGPKAPAKMVDIPSSPSLRAVMWGHESPRTQKTTPLRK